MPVTDERAQEDISPYTGIPRPQLDVVAHPVDTMVEAGQGRSLAQLASSLKDVSPELGELAGALQQRQRVAGQREAASLATPENFEKVRGDFKALTQVPIEQGGIHHFNNPFTVLYGREQFGMLAGEQSEQAYHTPEFLQALDGMTHPSDLKAAMDKARSTWEQGALSHGTHQDKVFQATYQKMANERYQQIFNSHLDRIDANFLGQTAATYGQGQASIMREALDNQDFIETVGPNAGQVAGHVVNTLQLQHYAALKYLPEKVVIEADAQSLQHMAEDVTLNGVGSDQVTAQDIFDLAKKMPGLRGGTLYDTPVMAQIRAETLAKINTQQRVQNVLAKQDHDQQREAVKNDAYKTLMQDIGSGKVRDVDAYASNLETLDPNAARTFRKDYLSLTGGTWNSNEGVRSNLEEKLISHPDAKDPDTLTRQEISDALNAHNLSPQDALGLFKSLETRQANHGRLKGPETDPVFTSRFNEWKTLITGSDFNTDGVKAAAQKRVNVALKDDWDAYIEANPTASEDAKKKHLDEAFKQILNHELTPDQLRSVNEAGDALPHTGAPVTLQNSLNQRQLPEDVVEELAGKLSRGRFELEDLTVLASYGITDPKTVRQIIENQAALYGIKIKKPTTTPAP